MKLTIEPRVKSLGVLEYDPLTLRRLTGKPGTGPKAIKTKMRKKDGQIPACIYGQGVSENVTVDLKDLEKNLRELKKTGGVLATTVFDLSDGRKAIVKEIQYHKANYAILHLDLFLVAKDKVTINVPIHIEGVDECVGVKLGGFLRQVVRTVKVQCEPNSIPSKFVLDVRELSHLADGDKKPNKSKRISDIVFPAGVIPSIKADKMDQVAVTVGKR